MERHPSALACCGCRGEGGEEEGGEKGKEKRGRKEKGEGVREYGGSLDTYMGYSCSQAQPLFTSYTTVDGTGTDRGCVLFHGVEKSERKIGCGSKSVPWCSDKIMQLKIKWW